MRMPPLPEKEIIAFLEKKTKELKLKGVDDITVLTEEEFKTYFLAEGFGPINANAAWKGSLIVPGMNGNRTLLAVQSVMALVKEMIPEELWKL